MTQVSAIPAVVGKLRSRLALPPAAAVGFVIAVVAVVLVAGVSYIARENTTSASRRGTHALETSEKLRALLSTVQDAETGQRGFLLTGSEAYLAPYESAKATIASNLEGVHALVLDNPQQLQRFDVLDKVVADKMSELQQTIDLRRAGNPDDALALVRTDRGKNAMDHIRSLIREMEGDERDAFVARQDEWKRMARFSLSFTSASSALLLFLIAAAAIRTSRDYLAGETRTWIRTGQMGFGASVQGEQRLDELGDKVLTFLANYMGAQIGTLYITEGPNRFRRVAGYATSKGAAGDELHAGEGLLGQAAKEQRALIVRDLPQDYLVIESSLGGAKPGELLVSPAMVDGVVHAVLELGFFRKLRSADEELIARVSEALGVAVRASKDRTRLEDLLEETLRQSEELQTQQEELRVSNEELEEQGRALKQSQAELESQQTELEQTNSQLEEQMQLLEAQRDDLAISQAAVAEKANELERSNRYKSEFLANMSHELRTPLNSTLILSKLLADNKSGNLTEQQTKFAQTIFSAGNDLLALINDILDLSKIESGKVDLTPESVKVSKTVGSLTATFEPLAQQKGLKLGLTIDPGTPEQFETDAQRFGQILKNLLSNALKFTEKGTVNLRVYSENAETISFAVRDSGIGIPEQQHAIIFEAFRQADGSTHRKYGGTGLGLSISRDLARLLGGDISIDSAPGKGSVFTLTLPLAYREAASDQHPGTRETAAPTADGIGRAYAESKPPLAEIPSAMTLKPMGLEDDRDHLRADARLVLIIEDDIRFAAILRDLAHEMGFQCVATQTAQDGYAAASTYRPSAILLDMSLPDYSGLSVLDQLKHNPLTRHIPVHVLSVADYTQEALERGAVGYALKPVKRERLVEAFKRLEATFSRTLRQVLIVEDDERQRESIAELLTNGEVQITGTASAGEALSLLRTTAFDCMVMDLSLPDFSGYELLERMSEQEDVSFPPVIVYTGRSLTRDEEQKLRRFSKSIIIKDARSPERLLDEVTLFIHQVESKLPADRQRMLRVARDRDATLEGRRILVVEDDVRNIFALSSVLEPKGAKIQIARNGREAIDALARSSADPAGKIDLVLMDLMMPEMDGLTAMQEIRKRAEWAKLPIIALTAKAMKDDREQSIAAGANDYIAKPLDVEKLISLVRVWMPK